MVEGLKPLDKSYDAGHNNVSPFKIQRSKKIKVFMFRRKEVARTLSYVLSRKVPDQFGIRAVIWENGF